MRKIIAATFVSLDGVMQAPGGPEEDPAGGFRFGGWTFHYWDDAMGAFGFLRDGHKWTNLQVRLREFMPVGVRPLVVPVT